MNTTRVRIDPGDPRSLPEGRIDPSAVDNATENDLALQQQQDDAEAMRDMARYARRVRRRLGLTQVEFARRIDVPADTVRNWEQGKRCPTGAARALLRVLDRAPEAALRVLTCEFVSPGPYRISMTATAPCRPSTRGTVHGLARDARKAGAGQRPGPARRPRSGSWPGPSG